MNRKVKSILIISLLVIVSLVSFNLLKHSNRDAVYYTSLNELNGTEIGLSTSSTFESIVNKKINNVKVKYYDNVTDRILALRNGKISAYITDAILAQENLRNNQDLTIIEEYIEEESYAYAIAPLQKELKKKIDIALKKLKEDGTLEYLQEKWFGDNEENKKLEDIKLTEKNGTIKFGTLATSAPFAYLKNGKIVGYDIDTMLYVCELLGYNLEVVVMDWSGLLTAVSVGKVDVAGCSIIVTDERKKSMLFSEPNYTGGVVAVVLKDTSTSNNLIKNLKTNFYNTFIKENRYKIFGNGILVTLQISMLRIIFGTILGIFLGIVRISKNHLLKTISKLFISIIQGMPITVLLLIMYYLIFVKIFISPIVVAVITFSIYMSAYIAEMIRGGYEAINKNQIQAAYALGFSKIQTIKYVIFPQLIDYVMPIYKGQIISTIKSTSVVGYIAVTDLTKVGDMVRSRTFDAFFSLIAVAIIYLIICMIFEKILELIEKNIIKKERSW